jgi:hypothetical protein
MVTDFSALPYRLGGNEVLASNGRIHTELRQVFLEFAEQDAPRIPS